MEAVIVRQSDLQKGSATPEQQEELDRRNVEIGDGKREDKDLFDPELEKKPEEKPPEEKPEEKPAKTGELSDAQLLEAEEGILSEEQKTRKTDLTKAKEVSDKKVEDKKIIEAKDEEDARKDLESIGKIVDNSKGDARLLAKNFLHLQRMKARTEEELKATKNAASQPRAQEITAESLEKQIEAGEITLQGKKVNKEELIEAYRGAHKDITGAIEDDGVVFKMVCKDMKAGVETQRRDQFAQLGVNAKAKKAKLIEDLSEADKKLLPQMQPILDNFTDRQIMGKDFSLEDLVLVTKGRGADKREKDAEARGFKRGVEYRRIIGEMKGPGADGKPKTKTSSNKSSLTDAQKKEAEDRFASNNVPLERKYELYEEIVDYEKELKEKKKKK